MTNGFLLLRDLLQLTRDGEWGKSEPDDNLVKMAVIRGTDFEDVRYGELSNLPVRFIKQAAADYKVLQVGDILIETAGGSKDRPTGKTVFINERILHNCNSPIICASFCRFLRVKRELAEPEYVFWYLQHLYNIGITANYQVQHTGIARFQYTVFAESIEIPLPPLDEQRAIAHILGSLDDKIEANRRLNETLEATARAIFKSWFVDFDPVHTKARGEHPPGMDAATAAMFPASFEESALGPIPRGWGVKSLDEVATYLNGLALQKYPAEEGTDFLPVIKIRELRQGRPDQSSNRANTSIPPAYVVDDGDVLFSWSGSLLVDIWTGGRGALNQHLFKVTSDRYPRWLYYFWTLFYLDEFIQIAADKATTMGHIKRHHLSDSLVVIPNDDILPALTAHIEPHIEAVVSNRVESRTLAETRDALLPRLVSGEVRVPHP